MIRGLDFGRDNWIFEFTNTEFDKIFTQEVLPELSSIDFVIDGGTANVYPPPVTSRNLTINLKFDSKNYSAHRFFMNWVEFNGINELQYYIKKRGECLLPDAKWTLYDIRGNMIKNMSIFQLNLTGYEISSMDDRGGTFYTTLCPDYYNITYV